MRNPGCHKPTMTGDGKPTIHKNGAVRDKALALLVMSTAVDLAQNQPGTWLC